ncbi:hypothetical protein APUTEX25_003537 [Auxenochlorella protothecoides]|uniref:dUTP diphosphatase n=1 Tax=Auxenochlorella protothecoides TaxID=3075 RepID=A0A3M7KY34_AUXPR|nr:hypothetical protein APUTEX25_003537 [Auxenochlorella protothecoides]|eukprot:RMZ55413.1 hypothetical protein APUTEX25_003537 [Auxenochlorella protothecoides]
MTVPSVAAHDGSVPPPSKLIKTGHAPALLVKKLSEYAVLPKRGSVGAAGYDLARCMLGRVVELDVVKRGDRVAQLILEVIQTPEVEEVAELPTTVRGAGGYGSTGVSVAL